ncbi:hypothetical protein P4O66_019042, partial [Electrophorus voltai]
MQTFLFAAGIHLRVYNPIALYIPPSANTREALQELYGAISELQNVHPDGLFIVAGDFNHANLKSVLPKFHQHVKFATRGANALDVVYTNISSAYRAEPRPHLGYSDHMSVMLIPAYRPIVRRLKPLLKQVRIWPAGTISALQDCFEQTTLITFKEAATDGGTVNLEEYTASVTAYISKCIDDVTVSKTITTRPNQKRWMTAEVRMLLRTRDSDFRTGDREALRKTRAKLSLAIREAKRAHEQMIHGHFKDTEALNDFYAWFEAQNNGAAEKSIPPQHDQTAADVRHTLRGVNPRKAAGPDNIPGRVFRECAGVLTDIFNISLSCAAVPTCFKTTTIIPVLKKPMVSCLNDYRPIALTSIIMKCFERLVMRHIKTQLTPSLDCLQFAYHSNCSTDDAISTTLHLALTHLDKKGTYVRMLFIDFSSAFNTIVPQHLIGKLSLLGLNTSLCNWILDFLTGRPQSVRIGSNTSNTTTLSTGAPQGSVLSPLLFTLLTHDCAAMHSSNHIIKFADDTTVVGLINKDNESAYREEVRELVSWCKVNNLYLNVDQTKEMVVDFRRARRDHSPLAINSSSVEIGKNIKFLGVHIAENLTWSLNTSSITKRAQQHLYFLRKLREAHLPSPILTTFYRGTDCTATSSSTIIVKFADDTVVMGLISDNNERAYLEEIKHLENWCQENNLLLNVSKTKELIVDCSKMQERHNQSVRISGTTVERVDSFRYLGVHISQDLSWSRHTNSLAKKARQRLYHLRCLRDVRLPSKVLQNFYTCTMESILTGNITVWFGNSTKQDRQALQRVVRSAERITHTELPDLQTIYYKRCQTKARRIVKDTTHPNNRLFSLLRSGRRFRSLKTKTERLKRSFFPQAIRAETTTT